MAELDIADPEAGIRATDPKWRQEPWNEQPWGEQCIVGAWRDWRRDPSVVLSSNGLESEQRDEDVDDNPGEGSESEWQGKERKKNLVITEYVDKLVRVTNWW